MPSINNIEKFAEILNSLGDEPARLEKRGEILEKAKVPPKTPKEENPFLVNPDQDNIDVPNLLDGLDDFDSPLEVDDFEDIPHIDQVPDLEEDSDFDPFDTDLEPSGLMEPEDFDSLDLNDNTETIDELDSSFDLNDFADTSNDLDDLSDFPSDLDNEESEDSFIGIDDLSDFLETQDEPEELGTLNSIDDIDELITMESDDTGIQDIDIDDIDVFSDDVEEIEDIDGIDEPSDFFSQETSLEDDVLEDDFGSLDDDDADEFSLGDFGDTFNLDEDNSSLLALDELSEEKIEEEAEIEELKITPEEFESLKKNLFNLPLNVRIAIEEEIAENGLFGKRLEELAYLLIDGSSAKEIVKYLNKKLGHKLKISPFFAKITAEELEAKKKDFPMYLLIRFYQKLNGLFHFQY
jgi:hypothetical protein